MNVNEANPSGFSEDGPLSMDALAPVLFGTVRSLRQLKEAYALVYTGYLDRGYINPNSTKMRFGFHNLLPRTKTFIASLHDTVIATISLVIDSPAGLPMDEIYRDELESFRSRGELTAEVTMLADRRRDFKRTLPMVLALFRMLMDHASESGVDHLCITLNPRHADFYRKVLHFKPLGTEKSYPSVANNPALAMYFPLADLAALLENDPRYSKIYHGTDHIRRASLEGKYLLNARDVRQLAACLDTSQALTVQQRQHLSELYGEDALD